MADLNEKRLAAEIGGRASKRAVSVARQPTVEDRLAAKAEVADATDFAQHPSLGQLSREGRRKVLFGE